MRIKTSDRNIRRPIWATIAVGFLAGCAATAQTIAGQAITSPRPLADAADLLQKQSSSLITYEDPVWTWQGDLATRNGDPAASWTLFPKAHGFIMPAPISPASAADAGLVQTVVQAYGQQNPGLTFQVVNSPLGQHIVPAQVYNASGQLAQASNPLDTPVTVASAQRTLAAHFQAICDAVTASSGVSLKFFAAGVGHAWLDSKFAPNTTAHPVQLTWGSAGTTARQALVSLLGQSQARLLSWRLFCQPSADPQKRFCVLNLVQTR
jgi:hypothetical protein